MDELKKLIREVPDFPKKGILFYDITTLFKDKAGIYTVVIWIKTKRNERPFPATEICIKAE